MVRLFVAGKGRVGGQGCRGTFGRFAASALIEWSFPSS
jgi:hypothetical protein